MVSAWGSPKLPWFCASVNEISAFWMLSSAALIRRCSRSAFASFRCGTEIFVGFEKYWVPSRPIRSEDYVSCCVRTTLWLEWNMEPTCGVSAICDLMCAYPPGFKNRESSSGDRNFDGSMSELFSSNEVFSANFVCCRLTMRIADFCVSRSCFFTWVPRLESSAPCLLLLRN